MTVGMPSSSDENKLLNWELETTDKTQWKKMSTKGFADKVFGLFRHETAKGPSGQVRQFHHIAHEFFDLSRVPPPEGGVEAKELETAKKTALFKGLQLFSSENGQVDFNRVEQAIDGYVQKAEQGKEGEQKAAIHALLHIVSFLCATSSLPALSNVDRMNSLIQAKNALSQLCFVWSLDHDGKKELLPEALMHTMIEVAVMEVVHELESERIMTPVLFSRGIALKIAQYMTNYPPSADQLKAALKRYPLPQSVYQSWGEALGLTLEHRMHDAPQMSVEGRMHLVEKQISLEAERFPCYTDEGQLLRSVLAERHWPFGEALHEMPHIQTIITRGRSGDKAAQKAACKLLLERAVSVVNETVNRRHGETRAEREPWAYVAQKCLEGTLELAQFSKGDSVPPGLFETWEALYCSDGLSGSLSTGAVAKGKLLNLSEQNYLSLARSLYELINEKIKKGEKEDRVVASVVEDVVAHTPFDIDPEKLKEAIVHGAVDEDRRELAKALQKHPPDPKWSVLFQQILDHRKIFPQKGAEPLTSVYADFYQRFLHGERISAEHDSPSVRYLESMEKKDISEDPEIAAWERSFPSKQTILDMQRSGSMIVGAAPMDLSAEIGRGEERIAFAISQAVFKEFRAQFKDVSDEALHHIVNELLRRTSQENVAVGNLFGFSSEANWFCIELDVKASSRFFVDKHGRAAVERTRILKNRSLEGDPEQSEPSYLRVVSKLTIDPAHPEFGRWTEKITSTPISIVGLFADEVKQEAEKSGQPISAVLEAKILWVETSFLKGETNARERSKVISEMRRLCI